MIPALLKWIGNKQRFSSFIVNSMPEKFNDYYEPFLGSGAVMAELLWQNSQFCSPMFNHAYGSDILPFLIDVFQIAKDRPSGLVEYYAKEIVEFSKDPSKKYEEIRDRFNKTKNPYDFLLLSRTCYSGIIRFRKSDGFMSTPMGPHKPIPPHQFEKRVNQWSSLIQKADFICQDFSSSMDRAKKGDLIYCDPPYTHSQSILYGAQAFDVNLLWEKIRECKKRGVFVILSINCMRESQKKDISPSFPEDLFVRRNLVNCGVSMIDRLQNSGKNMDEETVHDNLLFTW